MSVGRKGPSAHSPGDAKLCLLSTLFLLMTITVNPTHAQTNSTQRLCRAENGLSSIIVDIPESINDQLDQLTSPKELPIVGNPSTQIELTLVYQPETKGYFTLRGRQLRLNEPLDRDKDDISSVVFQVVCEVKETGEKRTIPIIVRVSDLNDNSPQFSQKKYETSIPESSPVGTTVFSSIKATDLDTGVNGLIEFSIPPSSDDAADESGSDLFHIESPHLGVVTLKRKLDYERRQLYHVKILASDRAFDPTLRKTSTATLTLRVLDSDDQGPVFLRKECGVEEDKCTNPDYKATVIRGVLSGILDVQPERIQAVDGDSLRSQIHYSFVTGSPSTFPDYFQIDPLTGVVRQVRPVLDDAEIEFNVILKATEDTPAKRFSTSKLRVNVLAEDKHRPVLHVSSIVGSVPENSPIGTPVLGTPSQEPIRFKVTDQDLAPHDIKPSYHYELTTTAFRVTEEGILVVGEEGLDRDPPNPPQIQFQIIGREIGDGFSGSSLPIVIMVKLGDVNDNPPFILPMSPVTIPGGDGRRTITKVHARDKDEDQNAQLRFSIHHVSNNGQGKFIIDPETGLLESVGNLKSGQVYSITVQATDGGGGSSQSILEVNVVDGVNLKPPLFSQFTYDVSVSEGASIGSEVTALEAKDPEGKSVSYELIGGNELNHFTIGKKTGVIVVNAELDREDLSRYSLLIKAEDEGGLFSTAQLNVKILDRDDNNPILLGTPYKFKVKEGLRDKLIGKVNGMDLDEGENGRIEYQVPPDAPIRVDPDTGDIYTKAGLDYEKDKVHKVVLTARGMGKESRIATATVTVQVEDDGDEMPVFRQFTHEVSVRENNHNSTILTVQADDPDTTEKKITYTIKQGPYDKFSIDPLTGEIFARQSLDYEEASKHILIVGTEENDSGNLGSTTTVIINVIDENDNPPIFSILPRPIRLEDTAHVGFVLTQLQAVDSDGTSPGNKVKYELIGRGKSYKYFEIHPDTGIISLKDDLRKEMDTEYQLDVRAYDLGEPPLDQVATVKVHVDHVATLPPDMGVGFADMDYTVEVAENSPAGKTLKELILINKPNELIPITCQIRKGNEEKLFEVTTTKDRNCLLSLLRPHLDFEVTKKYELQVTLATLPGILSNKRSSAIVRVKVLDENDNKAEFKVPPHQSVGRGKKLYGAISEEAQIGTSVLQVEAEDADSGSFGEVRYELDSENSLSTSYFKIDAKSGIVTNSRSVENISPSLLPFRLSVVAGESPTPANQKGGVRQSSQMPLIINVISSAHRIVLVLEGITPDKAKVKELEIVEIIQEISNLVVGIEKISPHHFFHSNGTVDTDNSLTDVWFYGVDPTTDHILDRESPKISQGILSGGGLKSISYFVSSKLSVRVREVRKPITRAPLPPAPIGPLLAEQQWAPFPAALVALAGLIVIVGLIGISLVCYKWSRYAAYKNHVQRLVVSPRYEPFYVGNSRSPSLKQYETQILQMRVNVDGGDNGSDLHEDLTLNRNSGGPAPFRRAESDLDHGNVGSRRMFRTFQTQGPNSATVDPMANPIYERSDDDDDGVLSLASESNENIHFQQQTELVLSGLHNNRR